MNHKQNSMLAAWCLSTFLVGCGNQRREPAQPQSPKPLPEKTTAQGKGQPTATRGPRQKHPEIVALPERPNPIGERLKREFSGLRPDEAAYIDKLRRLWQENISLLPKENLESVADEDVANGTRLPAEINTSKPTDRWKDTPAAMVGGLALLSTVTADELLPGFAMERAGTLPPSRTDLVIFEALNDALLEYGPSGKISRFEEWKPLAGARNPLYRLLALRAATRTPSREAMHLSFEDPSYSRIDGSAKIGFYLNFLNEADTRLLAETISAIATVPGPQAHAAIKKFLLTQQQLGDANLVEAAATALRTQELISRYSR